MHVIKAKQREERAHQDGARSRATGRMQAQKLIELIDESAPDDSVVDLHEVEKFADGTRRIPLPVEEAAVVAVVEGSADTTRRMSAVEWDAAISAVESEVHSESTTRMCAIQASELAALITPVEVSVVEEPSLAASVEIHAPVVTFRQPTAVPVESSEPGHRRANPWMIGALIALAGAIAGLAAVVAM